MNVRCLLAGATIFMGGCATSHFPEASAQNGSGDFAWTGAIRAGQTMEIKGVNGTIQVNRGSVARVSATKTARRSDPRDVEIVVIEHEQGVTICAVPLSSLLRPNECRPGSEGRLRSSNNDVKVTWNVELPAGTAFTGRNANGSIDVHGLSSRVEAYSSNGDIEIDGGSVAIARTTNGSVVIKSVAEASARTVNGRISAEMSRLTGRGEPLEFETTNGSVVLTIPRSTNAEVDAHTVNGRIESDVPLMLGRAGRQSLTGRLGDGGRQIRMRTVNGSISIEEAP